MDKSRASLKCREYDQSLQLMSTNLRVLFGLSHTCLYVNPATCTLSEWFAINYLAVIGQSAIID